MKTIKINIVLLLLLALPAHAISSLGSVASDRVTIETRPASNVRIIETSAVQSASDLVISGKVKRVSTYRKRWIPLGHINAVLFDNKGVILYETTADYLPRIIPKKTMNRTSKFTLKMPIVAPEGSVLRLSFRRQSRT